MSLTTYIEGDQACTKCPSSPEQHKVDPFVTVGPTSNELWKWTLTREAIASCFISDALVMRENSTKGKLSRIY